MSTSTEQPAISSPSTSSQPDPEKKLQKKKNGCKSKQHTCSVVKEFQDFKAAIGPSEYQKWKADVFALIALTDHIFEPNGAPARTQDEIEVEFGFINMIKKANLRRINHRLYALRLIFIWHGHLFPIRSISHQLTETNRKNISELLTSKNFEAFHRC